MEYVTLNGNFCGIHALAKEVSTDDRRIRQMIELGYLEAIIIPSGGKEDHVRILPEESVEKFMKFFRTIPKRGPYRRRKSCKKR